MDDSGVRFGGAKTPNGGENASELLETVQTNGFEDGASSVSTGMYSIFANDSFGLASKLTAAVTDICKKKNAPGKASIVTISGSSNFTGVLVQLTIKGTIYSQALIIDERPLKSIKQLLDDEKVSGGGTILFATALLFDRNKKYLESFDSLVKDTVKLDPLVVVAETVSEEGVAILARNLLMRLDATPFDSVKSAIDKDKGLDLVGNFNTDGQKVIITVSQKERQASLSDMIAGATGPILGVSGRMDTVLTKKSKMVNGTHETPFALRPVLFINAYEKPNTIASHNLEYGLMAIAAASLGLDKDKYISALMPTQKHKNNIGMLNPIFNIIKDAQGNAKPINLLDAKADLKMKTKFIDEITTSASIGIDIEYRVAPTALNVFGTINDNNASPEAKKNAAAAIQTAFRNITGVELTGNITEQVIQYPTGFIIDKSGNKMELKDLDAIWLASLNIDGAAQLAQEWIVSHTNTNTGFLNKLEILNKLMASSELDIKIKGVGYKIILHKDFLANLLSRANFTISSQVILELTNDDANNFSNVGIEIGVAEHISGIGRNPTFNNNSGLRIIG